MPGEIATVDHHRSARTTHNQTGGQDWTPPIPKEANTDCTFSTSVLIEPAHIVSLPKANAFRKPGQLWKVRMLTQTLQR